MQDLTTFKQVLNDDNWCLVSLDSFESIVTLRFSHKKETITINLSFEKKQIKDFLQKGVK